MVEQCGGHFGLESQLGVGTKARIWLPAADDAPRASSPSLAAMPRTERLRILAVDDDPIVLLNTATVLADMGHGVLQAESGQAALALLAENEVDLLLTDYAMPLMSGGDLIERARQTNPLLRVIVVSGYADVPEGVVLNVPRLAKPFTDTELAEAIAAVAD